MGILGDNIKAKRIERGLTQMQLAELMGYTSKAAICKVERGDDNITSDRIKKFAQALRCSEYELMGLSKEDAVKKQLRDAYVRNAEEQKKKDLIFAYLDQLNEEGFKEVIKRLEELSELSKYRKEDS